VQGVFLNDALGSTIALTDSTGTIVRSYAYDPDGKATSTGSGATTDLKFDGGHQIGGLYHYGARYYDPSTARWTQQDPLTNLGDLTQANRYSFAGDNPSNNTDLAGLCSYSIRNPTRALNFLGCQLHHDFNHQVQNFAIKCVFGGSVYALAGRGVENFIAGLGGKALTRFTLAAAVAGCITSNIPGAKV
jgi:RHS repeat-associated protein